MKQIKIIVVGLCLFISMAWGQMAVVEITAEKTAAMRQKAERGDAEAQYILGLLYRVGDGVAEDKVEAVKWYRKAAEQGLAAAQNNLAKAYWTGEGVITDEREAYIWSSIAKANGDETAADNFRKTKWRDYLSQSEIRAAQKEAKKRLDKINNP